MPHLPRTITCLVIVVLVVVCLQLQASGAAAAASLVSQAPPTAPYTVYLPFSPHDHDPSWRWQPPSPVLSPPATLAFDARPVAALDRQGQVHLLWSIDPMQPGGKFIYHSVLTTSGWTAPTPVRPTPGISHSPSMPLVGPDGRLHVLWLNQSTSTSPPRLLYSAYEDGVWSAEEEVFAFPTDALEPKATVQIDGTGQVYAIVEYYDIGKRVYQARRTAQGWQSQALPNLMADDPYDWVFGDQDGAIRRFFNRFETGDFRGYYSYWRDGAYLIQDLPVPFVPRRTFGQLDTGNNLHVYWGGGPMGQGPLLYHQCFDPAMTPASEPELLSGRKTIQGGMSAAADETDRWSLTWSQESRDHMIGLWHGCQRQTIVSLPLDPATPDLPEWSLLRHEPNRWCGVWNNYLFGYVVRCADIVKQ